MKNTGLSAKFTASGSGEGGNVGHGTQQGKNGQSGEVNARISS